MFSELPIEWQKKLDEEISSVRNNGFYLVDKNNKSQTLAVLFQPSKDTLNKLSSFTTNALPENLKHKLFIQPSYGLHVSLQWSKEFDHVSEDKFIKYINHYLQKLGPITADFYGLYPSDNNLFFVVDSPDAISEVRSDVSKIFGDTKAVPKLPKELGTLWMSVVRMVKQLTPQEIEQTISVLPHKVFKDIKLDKYHIAYADPFFTKKGSRVLYSGSL